MKVIKHGEIIRFECECCGCIFNAGINDCIETSPFQCICPDCGILVDKGERVEHLVTKRVECPAAK